MKESSSSNQTYTEDMTLESLEDTLLSDGTDFNLSSVASKRTSDKKLCILDMDSYILKVSSQTAMHSECQSLCSKCDASVCSERSSCGTNGSEHKENVGKEDPKGERCMKSSFLRFRLQYLLVHMAIMLADGLQGE